MATYAVQGQEDHYRYQWIEIDGTIFHVLLDAGVKKSAAAAYCTTERSQQTELWSAKGRKKNHLEARPRRRSFRAGPCKQEKEALDNSGIMANAALFILAGTETVATLLCAVVYLLTQSPVALDRLTRAIRDAIQDESQLTLHNLSKMTYLTACINEALRLVPPVPEGLPRVTPQEGESICGCWVPGGVRSSLTCAPTIVSELSL